MEKEKATEVTGCKQCKKGLSTTQQGLLVLGLYILLSSVVGTIAIVKYLVDLF